MTVRIGIGLFTGQVPAGSSRTFDREYRDTLELVRLAESVGFDSAWVSEHHGSSDGYLPSLLPMLAAIAASTERLLLGTGVLLTPFHDPLRLAEDTAVVDQLSGGRLLLGLGGGWREEEFRMFGVRLAERGSRTEETIEILRRAWTGRRFSFEGRAFRYDRVKVTPPPARTGGPPIYVGGYADAVLRRTGRIADGYISSRHEQAVAHVAVVEESARAAGRDPAAVRVAVLRDAFVWTGTDAWGAIRQSVAYKDGAYEAWDEGADTPGNDELVIGRRDEAELRASVAAGTPEQVRDALRPLVSAFGDRADFDLVVRLSYPGMDLETASAAVKLFASEVLPALKGA